METGTNSQTDDDSKTDDEDNKNNVIINSSRSNTLTKRDAQMSWENKAQSPHSPHFLFHFTQTIFVNRHLRKKRKLFSTRIRTSLSRHLLQLPSPRCNQIYSGIRQFYSSVTITPETTKGIRKAATKSCLHALFCPEVEVTSHHSSVLCSCRTQQGIHNQTVSA